MTNVIITNGKFANGTKCEGTFITNGKRFLTIRDENKEVIPGTHKVCIQKDNGKNAWITVLKDDYTYSNNTTSTPAPVVKGNEEVEFENKVTIKREFIPEVHEIEVPAVSPLFTPGANFKTVSNIIKSNMFMPILITGPSGNGKTFMAQQACAKAKRKMIRVQISPETDEDSLIGGMRLIEGNTVFEKGPVINAMESGAVLLIDEIDRGSNKIMCLQGIMEGSDFVIKRTGETVKPAPGFTIIATGNTKGNGSDDGSFSAATVIDDAFLERFTGVVEQGWPTASQEYKILEKHSDEFNIELTDDHKLLLKRLTRWVKTLRASYAEDGIEGTISTRRLAHILKMYSVVNDINLAINMACSNFDEDTKDAMISTFNLITGNEIDDEDE